MVTKFAVEGHRPLRGQQTDVEEGTERLSSNMHKSSSHEVQEGNSHSVNIPLLVSDCMVKH